MSKVLNFDKFMSEKKKETITVTVFGKDYKVPGEIPAIVPVMMARSEEAMNDDASVQLVMKAADILFGKEAVNEICAKGMSAADLANLVQHVFKTINSVDEEDDEVQELDDETGKVAAPSTKPVKK